jgi:hypothetical protein
MARISEDEIEALKQRINLVALVEAKGITQKLPHLVASFFQTPTCRYAAL